MTFFWKTQLPTALENVNSLFCMDFPQFLEDIISMTLSISARCFLVRQGLSFSSRICNRTRWLIGFPPFWPATGWTSWSQFAKGLQNWSSKGRVPLLCTRATTGRGMFWHNTCSNQRRLLFCCGKSGFRSRCNFYRVSTSQEMGILSKNISVRLFLLSQLCQLTGFAVKGWMDLPTNFIRSLEWVAFGQLEVKGAISRVQDFVRNPIFTLRNLSDLELAKLGAAAASSSSNCRSVEIDSWRTLGVPDDSLFADPETCPEKVLVRRESPKDTHQRWFAVESVASSKVEERAPCIGIRIA